MATPLLPPTAGTRFVPESGVALRFPSQSKMAFAPLATVAVLEIQPDVGEEEVLPNHFALRSLCSLRLTSGFGMNQPAKQRLHPAANDGDILLPRPPAAGLLGDAACHSCQAPAATTEMGSKNFAGLCPEEKRVKGKEDKE